MNFEDERVLIAIHGHIGYFFVKFISWGHLGPRCTMCFVIVLPEAVVQTHIGRTYSFKCCSTLC